MSPETEAAARCAHCGGRLLDTTAVHFPERRGDDDARSPLVGRVVDGKYRIVGVLGRGGMGTVYRAVHEVSLVPVALKVLHPRYAARQDFRAWFLAEARKAGRVVHENSARVMDVGVARDGMVYIAVEFVDGVTLQEWMTGEPAAPAAVVALLEQIARALASAHAAGVVHRDLSPRNVMVTIRDGRSVAKILDFGIAIGPPPSAGTDPGDGAPAGFANPPYSAPEHLAGEAVDGRADLYSLGVIAYEALSGEIPVTGNTGRELARATLHGRVRPFRPRSGVPKALVRLVHQLLAREPADRPASADEVAERIARLRQPGRRALAALSVIALVASTAAFAIAHAPSAAPEAYLQTRSGPGLVLRDDLAAAPVQELRRADLQATRFDFGGFDPAQLKIDVTTARGKQTRLDAGPLLRVDGDTLHLAAGAATAFEGLARISDGAPMELRFSVPDRAPLGYARLRLDDQPPEVALEVRRTGDDGWPGVLRGDDTIAVRITEGGSLRSARLTVEWPEDAGGEAFSVPLEGTAVEGTAVAFEARADEFLAARLPGTRRRGAAELRVVATDGAGNVGFAAPVRCADLDLAAPQILDVSAARRGGRVVVDEREGPHLRILLDGEESGLALLVRRPGESDLHQVSDLRVVGDSLYVRLRSPDPGSEEAVGRWGFVVRDAAGNTSAEFVEELEFRTADPAVELDLIAAALPGSGIRAVVRVGEVLVGSGEPFRLSLRHNSIYEVDRARATPVDGGASEVPVPTERVGPEGQSALAVPRLEPGTYDLEVRLVEPIEGRPVELPPWRLWILPETVTLRIPDVRGALHLPDLEERSVLRRDDGRVLQGVGWRLDPPDARILRGRVWSGVGGRPLPQEPLAATDPDDPIMQSAPLGRGWHTIAVSLNDVLGRPVSVLLGEEPAPTIDLPEGGSGQQIVRFFHHDEPLTLVEPFALVEHGQPVRLELRSVLPEADDSAVRVRFAGAELAPARIASDPDGARLSFELPFDRVVVAAEPELAALAPSDFGEGRDARLEMGVSTPVGEGRLAVPLRTIRSTLRAIELGDLAAGRALPDAIAGIRLVPVPVPGGVWRDPVPDDVPGRRRYRPSPAIDVRNVPDFYLQERETTRGQYVAMVRAGLEELERRGNAVDRRRFVHRADPLGLRRLTEESMVPTAQAGDPAGFFRAVADAPERPVSGVDAFQVHAAVALLGLCVDGDPEFFRLPLGCELEIAALAGHPGARNGSAARGPGLVRALLATFGGEEGRFGAWPPDVGELARGGDVVETELADSIAGLDTGLREWVLDLPFFPGSSESRVLLEEWLGDHPRHVQQALALAAVDPASRVGRIPSDLRAHVETYGVVRGVPVDRAVADSWAARGTLPAGWPGVVTALQLRRDGAGLVPGQVDPRLASCGFRLAGGERFVDEVRARW